MGKKDVVTASLSKLHCTTAIDKQLNFSVTKHTHTQLTTYYKLHDNFMIKSLRGNCIDCFEAQFQSMHLHQVEDGQETQTVL